MNGGSLVLKKQVSLRSESGPAATIFEASAGTDGPVLVCSNRNVRVEGLTLKGGSASDGYAGGLRIYGGTATNCIVTTCASTASSSRGGGVYMDEDALGLYGCMVTNCTSAGSGGGVYLLAGEAVGCVIAKNVAAGGGGGIYISGTVDPVFRDCIVRGNRARGGDGGGAAVHRATDVRGCFFLDNVVSGYGGGIYLGVGSTIADCVVSGNSGASRGGGIYTSAAPVSRCVVSGNTCTYFAGGIFTDTSRIDNCLITCNTNTSTSSSTGGGGTFCREDAVVVNCTYAGNAAYRAQSAWVDAAFQIRNCVFLDGVSLSSRNVVTNIGYGTKATAQASKTYASCVFDSVFSPVEGTGTITANPKLDVSYVPRKSSPCVNAGRNSYVRSGDTDLNGRPRIHVFGGKAKYDVVDMGCFETDFLNLAGTRLFVQ